MAAKSNSIGREVIFDKITSRWLFKDTMTPCGHAICKHCGKYVDSKYPDPCLSKLPGVKFACCGHGRREMSYIMFENGFTIRGFLSHEEWMDKIPSKHKRSLLKRIIMSLL